MSGTLHITGAGVISANDSRYVEWVGRTKGGKAVRIILATAICLSNPDWTFAEKDETIPEVEFTALYDDEKLAKGDRTEPWELLADEGIEAGSSEIILGVGKFYIGTSSADKECFGLTRGGGSFVVEREYKAIAADDDPGMVEGRIEQTSGQPKLKLKALQWLTKVKTIYPGMKDVVSQVAQSEKEEEAK